MVSNFATNTNVLAEKLLTRKDTKPLTALIIKVDFPVIINSIIQRALITPGITAMLEPSEISRKNGKRPDGIPSLEQREAFHL